MHKISQKELKENSWNWSRWTIILETLDEVSFFISLPSSSSSCSAIVASIFVLWLRRNVFLWTWEPKWSVAVAKTRDFHSMTILFVGLLEESNTWQLFSWRETDHYVQRTVMVMEDSSSSMATKSQRVKRSWQEDIDVPMMNVQKRSYLKTWTNSLFKIDCFLP